MISYCGPVFVLCDLGLQVLLLWCVNSEEIKCSGVLVVHDHPLHPLVQLGHVHHVGVQGLQQRVRL